MLPVLRNHFFNKLIPVSIDKKLRFIHYDFLPKALPSAFGEATEVKNENEFIEIPIAIKDGSTFNKKVKKPKLIIIGIGDSSLLPEQEDSVESDALPDVVMIIVNTFKNDQENKGEEQNQAPLQDNDPINSNDQVDNDPINSNDQVDNDDKSLLEESKDPSNSEWEKIIDGDLDSEMQELVDLINGGGVADEMTTSSGFAEKIADNHQEANDTIRSFINVVKKKNVKKILKKKSHLINPSKAVIEMLVRPHKVLDHKKVKKRRPQIYALIDSWDSYYGDKGEFLNQFAETCLTMGIPTWRANKLSKDYYKEDDPEQKLKGRHSHLVWADFAKIKKNSLILFVGDGCLGHSSSEVVWKKGVLEDFSSLYNPYWVHYFAKTDSCGCDPKPMAMRSGWNFYYGIKKVNNLIDYIHE